MKKIIYIYFLIIVLFAFLLAPKMILATYGACSNHNGVNCSLSNGIGSVICNDGTNDSSTSYSNLDECKGVRCDPNAVSAYAVSQGMAGSSFGSSAVDNCNNFNKNLDNSLYTPPIPSINTSGLAQQLADRSMDNWCKTHIGGQSYWDHPTMNCECNAGFLMVNNLCVNAEQVQYNQQQKDKADKMFDDAFNQALNDLPQYKGIADKETVRSMAIQDASDPNKENLTIEQVIEGLYPNVQPLPTPDIQATTTPTTAPVIQPSPPKPETIDVSKFLPKIVKPVITPIKNVKEQKLVNTVVTRPQPIKSNSMFSKIWNFIKGIF